MEDRLKKIKAFVFDVDGVLFEDCDEIIYTETMRERKQIMEDRSDAFIAVPGGVGTFEELFEGVYNVEWENFIQSDCAFPVKGNSLNEEEMKMMSFLQDIKLLNLL